MVISHELKAEFMGTVTVWSCLKSLGQNVAGLEGLDLQLPHRLWILA